MTPDVVTVRAQQSVRAAARLMAANQTDYLVVVDEGRVVGVVTARDLVTRAYAQGDDGDGRVREACSSTPLTANIDDHATDVLLRMRRRGLRRIPVVEDDRLVGLLCDTDLPILAAAPTEPLGVVVKSPGRPRTERADGVPLTASGVALPANVVPWPAAAGFPVQPA